MATITPPAYQKDAIPTPQGWRHPKTGELLHAVKLSVEDVDAYNNPLPPLVPAPVDQVIYEEDEDWDEDDWEEEEIDLDSMTKAELIETAENWEVEIDPKASKAAIKQVLESELF